MTLSEIIEDEVKYPRLRLISGGRSTPPVGEDWLSALTKGTVFTCKRKGMTLELELLIIAFKHAKTVVLVDGLNGSPRRAVDPKEFCKVYSHFETIEEGVELPEGDPNDSPPLLASRVDHNEDAS